ncbi:asparagine synthase (glutamine-hydrolyzing) [soil metagenome]
MCGICGYVGRHHPELLSVMSNAMPHRGPDDAGEWFDANDAAGLAHRRLSIIDLSSAGHQPMSNEDGSVWLTFNGEIYNFQELRDRLIAKGHTFSSSTDSEVLVHLYEEHGPDLVHELNGMFAFGIWNRKKRQLLLAKDHAGIKPLYYLERDGALYFASELKALLPVLGAKRELDREALLEYLTFLWVPGERTMLKGVKKLEPGHLLIWQNGRTEVRSWFSLAYEPDDSLSVQDWVERVHDTVMRATRRQMVSDVPLGAFLSGGCDSSSIVACMRRAFPDREIRCYTARFPSGDGAIDNFAEDFPYAVRVAEHLDVSLKYLQLRPDVTTLFPKMVWHLDEPDADPAMFLSYLICKSAREDGTTVLLSGTGGDEALFGYRSHQAYRYYQRLGGAGRAAATVALQAFGFLASSALGAQHAAVRRAGKFRRGLRHGGLDRHLALVDWTSADVRNRLLSDDLRRELGERGAADAANGSIRRYYESFQGSGEINRHTHLLMQTFLGAHNLLYTDKSSMASSVEVRVPYTDVELLRLCAQIPEHFKIHNGVPKYLLKKAMERYLPKDVLYRSKTGFMLPIRHWLVSDLREMTEDLLSASRTRSRGLFDPAEIRRVIDENVGNVADHAYLVYALLTRELWQQTFLDGDSQIDLDYRPTIKVMPSGGSHR